MLHIPVYLDFNATTPCDPRVMEAMLPYFTSAYGNAASHNHALGWQAAEAVDLAREQVAKLIGADPREIIFTSGATESANLALKGIFEAYTAKGNHIITFNTEHRAVLDTCKYLEKRGGEITYLPVGNDGQPDLHALEAAIRPSTILIAVMYANNETGAVMPVKAISEIARKHEVPVFSDATQAVGKIPVNVDRDGIDLMAFSAHKLYGPKGAGALYVRRKNPRITIAAQIHGGGHEKNLRSGTLNVPAIAGFGKACELCMVEMEPEAARLSQLRNKLESALLQLPESYFNGDKEHRLPHVSNLAFRYVEGNNLMMGLNKTLAVSSGSACTSATPEPSHVLKALGLGDELAHSSIRFALGRYTTAEEIDFAIAEVTKTVNSLRDSSPLWEMHKEGIEVNNLEWAHH
jgi:cysteine desulfurase